MSPKEAIELSKTGYAGVNTLGQIVDRRTHPNAVPMQANSMYGVPAPLEVKNSDFNPSTLGEDVFTKCQVPAKSCDCHKHSSFIVYDKWTKHVPDETGYYWWCNESKSNLKSLEVSRSSAGEFYTYVGNHWTAVKNLSGWWIKFDPPQLPE